MEEQKGGRGGGCVSEGGGREKGGRRGRCVGRVSEGGREGGRGGRCVGGERESISGETHTLTRLLDTVSTFYRALIMTLKIYTHFVGECYYIQAKWDRQDGYH